jgi:hypothetical protein
VECKNLKELVLFREKLRGLLNYPHTTFFQTAKQGFQGAASSLNPVR